MFSYAHLPSIYLWWSACSNLLPILSLGICFLIKFWEFFIYSRHKFFLRYVICKYYFLCVTCLIFVLTVSFEEQKFWILRFSLLFFHKCPLSGWETSLSLLRAFLKLGMDVGFCPILFLHLWFYFLVFLIWWITLIFFKWMPLIFWMGNFKPTQQMSHHIPTT